MEKLNLRKPESITIEDSEKLEGNLLVEPKLDGARVIVQKDREGNIKIMKAYEEIHIDYQYGVTGISYNEQFPEIISYLNSIRMPTDSIFLGEMVCFNELDGDNPQTPYDFWFHGSNFWKLASRIQTSHPLKIKLAAKRNPAMFVAFDTIKYEGESCEELSYFDRQTLYHEAFGHHINSNDKYRRASCVSWKSLDSIRAEFKRWQKQKSKTNYSNWLEYVCKVPTSVDWNQDRDASAYDLEGVVLKDPHTIEHGKHGYIQSREYKLKMFQESTFRIVGIESKQKLISSLQLERRFDGVQVGNVAWHGEQSETMKKELIGKLAKVRHMITDEGKIRFPSLLEIVK